MPEGVKKELKWDDVEVRPLEVRPGLFLPLWAIEEFAEELSRYFPGVEVYPTTKDEPCPEGVKKEIETFGEYVERAAQQVENTMLLYAEAYGMTKKSGKAKVDDA